MIVIITSCWVNDESKFSFIDIPLENCREGNEK